MDYDELKAFLSENGYEFLEEEIEHGPRRTTSRVSRARGNGVTLGFGEPGTSDPRLDGKIAADNEKCFDKWSKCPLVLEFPRGEGQAQDLLRHLDFLGGKAGYDLSNGYGYLDHNPFVYRVR